MSNNISALSLSDILAALNSGTVNMEDVIKGLKTETSFVRQGNNFRELKIETVSRVNGNLANVYTLGEKIDRDGNKVVAKTRKKKDNEQASVPTPSAPTRAGGRR
jgi:hypothetical protein